MIERNIGVVGDSPTDRLIFEKIVETILLEGQASNDVLKFIELRRQSLRDHIDRYWQGVNSETGYYLPGKPAEKLQDNVLGTLEGAFYSFEKEVESASLSNRDILLVTTDAERWLNNSELYFEVWAFSLSKILTGAVEKFYHAKVTQGYPYEYLPIVIMLASFPSTEIFVSAARNMGHKHYGKKPPELKRLLYKTDDLRTLKPGALKKLALDFITPESINAMFTQIPEARLFIQTLSFGDCL